MSILLNGLLIGVATFVIWPYLSQRRRRTRVRRAIGFELRRRYREEIVPIDTMQIVRASRIVLGPTARWMAPLSRNDVVEILGGLPHMDNDRLINIYEWCTTGSVDSNWSIR